MRPLGWAACCMAPTSPLRSQDAVAVRVRVADCFGLGSGLKYSMGSVQGGETMEGLK